MDVNWDEVFAFQKRVEDFLDNWIKENEYDNGGAIANPPITRESFDDGDIRVRLTLPYAAHNSTWSNSVLKLLDKLRAEETFKPDVIYLESGHIALDYHIHSCDPD